MRAPISIVLAAAAIGSPISVARAKSCLASVAEQMDLSLVGVYRGTRRVSPPKEMLPFDRLWAYEGGGHGYRGALLMASVDLARSKKFFLRSPVTPTPAVAGDIAHAAGFKRVGSCGSLPYISLIPGDYVYDGELWEWLYPPLITEPTLAISADRKRVVLRFIASGRHYRALYRVRDISFP